MAFSRDGTSFGEQIPVGRDDGGSDAEGAETYGNLIAADGARYVRVTADRPLADLTVVDLDTRDPSRDLILAGPAVEAAGDQPAIITRAEWGADERYRFDANGQELFSVDFAPIQKIVIHHTASRNGDSSPAATVRAIYHEDAVTRHWGDIGYNFLVDEAGRIYEGRRARAWAAGQVPTGQDVSGNGVVGAHAADYNAGTVGIALIGTLTDRDATPAARGALARLIAWIVQTHGIDPRGSGRYVNPIDGTSGTFANVAGHRHVGQTLCPGTVFYARLPALRDAVAALVATMPPGVPWPPSGLLVAPQDHAAALRWGAPATGGSPITGYTVSASPGGPVCATAGEQSCVARDLVNGVPYAFTVTATNAVGTGPPSEPSWSITPGPDVGRSRYVAITPARLVDTRTGTGLSGGVPAVGLRTFQVTNRDAGNPATNVPAGAIAVTGVLAVLKPDAPGYLSLTTLPDSDPATHTLDFADGADRSAAVTVPLSPGGTLSVTYQGAPTIAMTQVTFDVTGYFVANPVMAPYVPISPDRVLDSRSDVGSVQVTDRAPGVGATNVPADAVAITGILTVMAPTHAGWLSVATVLRDDAPVTLLGFPAGATRAHAVTVPLGPGGILSVACFGTGPGVVTRVTFDVTGYFAYTGRVGAAPTRALPRGGWRPL